jgi:RNA polymerase sigma-B factor
VRLRRPEGGGAQREAMREKVIGPGMPLAEHIARKFAGCGENFDDLLQISRTG